MEDGGFPSLLRPPTRACFPHSIHFRITGLLFLLEAKKLLVSLRTLLWTFFCTWHPYLIFYHLCLPLNIFKEFFLPFQGSSDQASVFCSPMWPYAFPSFHFPWLIANSWLAAHFHIVPLQSLTSRFHLIPQIFPWSRNWYCSLFYSGNSSFKRDA